MLFFEAFASGSGWIVLGIGFVLISIATLNSLYARYKLMHISYSLSIGMTSPQPAVLGYAEEQAKKPLPGIGYTLMFPFAIIINVVLAQVLLITLMNLGL